MEINSLHIVGKLIKKQKYSEYGELTCFSFSLYFLFSFFANHF